MATKNTIAWESCEGRNGWDSPKKVPENMAVEALNVSLQEGLLGIKRTAATAMTMTGDAFTGANALFRFVPAQNEQSALIFIVSNDATPKILKSFALNCTNLTLDDNISATPWLATAAALNGKLFIAYPSGVNRLHIYSPSESTTLVRRAGIKAPAVPTVADQGVGTYAAIPRWYATCVRVKSGASVLRQSNLTAGVAFTPSATGLSARVTKAAATGDGETHWVVWGSVVSINGPFYPLSEIVVGTTTFDDTQDPNTYSTNGDAAPVPGSRYPFPSVKYLKSDGKRLLGLGVWESAAGDSVTPQPGTVYITPVLLSSFGTGAGSDDERFQATADQVDTIVLNLQADAVDRGLSDPVNNTIYAFQSRGIWALTPTGNSQTPYTSQQIDKNRGALSHQSIVIGMDAQGRQCVYFLNPFDGPNRISLGNSIEWCGKDVYDIWQTMNLAATIIAAHGVFDYAKKEVKWWVTTHINIGSEPDTMIVFNVMLGRVTVRGSTTVRYGWSKWTGKIAAARCSVMATPVFEALALIDLPYIGRATAPYILRQDGALNTDDGTAFQAYVLSGILWRFASRTYRRLYDAYVTAKAAAVTIRQTIIRNYGQDSPTDDVSIAAAGTETRVIVKAQQTNFGECKVAQVQLGDSAAANTAWTLEGWDASTEVSQDTPAP